MNEVNSEKSDQNGKNGPNGNVENHSECQKRIDHLEAQMAMLMRRGNYSAEL